MNEFDPHWILTVELVSTASFIGGNLHHWLRCLLTIIAELCFQCDEVFISTLQVAGDVQTLSVLDTMLGWLNTALP